MKNITLADIAAKTGFSINTVSHALHDNPDISQKTKDYIIKTANEIGYIANSSASSLRSGKTKSIAIICGDISNPYFSIVIREMEITLKNYGYTSFIINTDENQKIEKNAIISAISRGADGIVLCPVQQSSENIDFIKSKKMPYILIGRRFDETSSYVVCDDENGGKLAATHLFDEGRKKFLFLNGPSYISSANERLFGIKSAFKAANVPLENLCVEEISITTEQTIKTLLSKHSDCDAVICFSDLIAMHVCHCLKEEEKNVPQDTSVIGFDNIASNFYFSPMLSSVTSSKRKMASFAIETLMKMIETDDLTPINKIFKTRLILRETTKE